jgi:hypothetical protein
MSKFRRARAKLKILTLLYGAPVFYNVSLKKYNLILKNNQYLNIF